VWSMSLLLILSRRNFCGLAAGFARSVKKIAAIKLQKISIAHATPRRVNAVFVARLNLSLHDYRCANASGVIKLPCFPIRHPDASV
jgi:hypothetical protein